MKELRKLAEAASAAQDDILLVPDAILQLLDRLEACKVCRKAAHEAEQAAASQAEPNIGTKCSRRCFARNFTGR